MNTLYIIVISALTSAAVSAVTTIAVCRWFCMKHLKLVDKFIEETMHDMFNAVNDAIDTLIQKLAPKSKVCGSEDHKTIIVVDESRQPIVIIHGNKIVEHSGYEVILSDELTGGKENG